MDCNSENLNNSCVNVDGHNAANVVATGLGIHLAVTGS